SMMHVSFYFVTDTPRTTTYTLSLHDALPISVQRFAALGGQIVLDFLEPGLAAQKDPQFILDRLGLNLHLAHRPAVDVPPQIDHADRKSTRLNSSHVSISYAVFCLKKKKQE